MNFMFKNNEEHTIVFVPTICPYNAHRSIRIDVKPDENTNARTHTNPKTKWNIKIK